MKRERAKELLPIIQAYAEGKKIQCSCVTLDGDNYNMQELLKSYTFLDGSPCGVRNGEEESDT